jgi:hypothetical protein
VAAKPKQRQYRVLVGCDVGNGYHEPGEVLDDIPPKQIPAWLDEGVIELVDPDADDTPKDAA